MEEDQDELAMSNDFGFQKTSKYSSGNPFGMEFQQSI